MASRQAKGVELARRTLLGALLGGVAAGCQDARSSLAPGMSASTFVVSNSLIAPITLSIDGSAYAIIPGGSTMSLTTPPKAQWLTWTSAKPKDADGNRIPDDIGEVRVAVAGIYRELDIVNVIDDQPYFTAKLFNDTSVPVSIGVYNGQSVACAGVLPGVDNGIPGFVLIGYYRLMASTEVRAYREMGCTGSYIAWPRALLSGAEPNTGLVSLTLEESP